MVKRIFAEYLGDQDFLAIAQEISPDRRPKLVPVGSKKQRS
jgi:hypothetical protein